jgi:hypothetical protein
MLELVTRLPGVEGLFKMMADAAANWEGCDPMI